VKSGEFSDMGSPDRPLSEAEREIIQRGVDRIYDDFISKVAQGRKLDKAAVDSIAQGRVWTGTDAKQIGLVDELGGMDKALEIALKKANLTEYKIVSYPEEKSALDNFLKSMSEEASVYFTKKQLGESYRYYEMVKKVGKYNGIQARLTDPTDF
jgi:protease-4